MAAHYLYSHEEDPWMEDVKWSTDKTGRTFIKAFRFIIGMRDISSTGQQTAACDSFRKVSIVLDVLMLFFHYSLNYVHFLGC